MLLLLTLEGPYSLQTWAFKFEEAVFAAKPLLFSIQNIYWNIWISKSNSELWQIIVQNDLQKLQNKVILSTLGWQNCSEQNVSMNDTQLIKY